MPIIERPRRLRKSPALRRMVRETTLAPSDLIAGMFIVEGKGIERPISSMPGHSQLSVDMLGPKIESLAASGVPAVLLFGIVSHKDATGSGAWDEMGPVPQAIHAIKKIVPEMVVIADVCMCEYTEHGHCGILDAQGFVKNDETIALLGKAAATYATAGADIVAPSAMMDGQVAAIRQALDEQGYFDTPIMAYAAKFASAYYGPFREAAESTPQFGDRKSYQMDPANGREAMREVELDVDEGADIIMVKPAGPYLDIIRQVRDQFTLPVAAYQVSGEYAMLKAAANNGWIDERRSVLEALTGIKRAGADMIITYYAEAAARWLSEGEIW